MDIPEETFGDGDYPFSVEGCSAYRPGACLEAKAGKFNPFLWIAMKKSAEDLELSCDEAVLVHADADTRRRYAELILKTAGDSRGFTTCLSASAASLRYRLRQVVRPGRRHSGALLAGLFFFLLAAGCSLVTLG